MRQRLVRALWALSSLLQLAVFAVSPVADARDQGESNSVVAHVESHGTKACARVHAEDCAVCRIIAAAATTTQPARLSAPIVRSIDAALHQSDNHRGSSLARGYPSNRAPPALA